MSDAADDFAAEKSRSGTSKGTSGGSGSVDSQRKIIKLQLRDPDYLCDDSDRCSDELDLHVRYRHVYNWSEKRVGFSN